MNRPKIRTREELKEYLNTEQPLYWTSESKKDKFLDIFTAMPSHSLQRYMKLLRTTEYFYNNRRNAIFALLYLITRRRKNKLGQKLGIEIFENTFAKGLHIFHAGNIVINGNAIIGENCLLHGSNCIGNSGKGTAAPVIGNNVRIGVGAKVIGDVTIADNITIAAGAVVVNSFLEEGITIAGIPARKIK